MSDDNNPNIMKVLCFMVPLLLASGAMAQSSTPTLPRFNGPCGTPPCAPGHATHVWQGSISQVRVKCENTSIFPCFTVVGAQGAVTPDKMAVGTTGVLKVNDASGKVTGDQPTVTCVSADDKDGLPAYNFTKK